MKTIETRNPSELFLSEYYYWFIFRFTLTTLITYLLFINYYTIFTIYTHILKKVSRYDYVYMY